MVELDVIANDAGLANDDTRSVVDKEVFANFCTGVNVDSRILMRCFRHDSSDDALLEFVTRMGNPVGGHA